MNKKVQEYQFRKEYEEMGFKIERLSRFFSIIPASQREQPHRVKFYIILFITQGNGTHQIDFQTYHYQKNDILSIG